MWKNRIQWSFFVLLALGLGALVFSICLLSLVPPVSRDALVHHLAVPKIYLALGRMIELPCMEFSYFPMNLELLYMAALYFGSDIAPKFIHGFFGLLTAFFVFLYLKKRLDKRYGLLGAVLFLSIPIIIKLSITAYVDLGLVFFSFAAMLSVICWVENQFKVKYLIMSGCCAGLAMGTKYNGLITFFLLTLFIPIVYSRTTTFGSKSVIKPIAWALVFVTTAGILFSPWMIRNIIWKGNPLYPLYSDFFPARTDNPCVIDETSLESKIQKHLPLEYRRVIYNESWLDIFLLPTRIFFQGKDNNPQFFDGKLSISLLLLPFFAFWRPQPMGKSLVYEKWFFLAFVLFYFLFAVFSFPLRIRYIAPIVPCLVVLSVFGLKNLFACLEENIPAAEKFLLFVIILGSLGYSVWTTCKYLKLQYQTVNPVAYISRKVTRDDYIALRRPEYPVMKYINRELSRDSTILFIYLGRRGYYCDRNYIPDENHNLFIFYDMIRNLKKNDEICAWFKKRGITHLLMNHSIVEKRIRMDLDEKEARAFFDFMETSLSVKIIENGFGLYAFN